MKAETQERLRQATAELFRAILASSWFWEASPSSNNSVQTARARLRRAARKANGGPLAFLQKQFPGPWLSEDARLPEVAAVILVELVGELARIAADPEALKAFASSEQTERRITGRLLAFYTSLAARPGRPRTDFYREPSDLYLQGERSHHQLCLKFVPAYVTMSKEQQRKMRDRMRNGVNRDLVRRVTRTKPAT